MAKLTLKKAATDVTVYLFAQNSSLTTGAGLTGLAYNTASLTAYYVRPLGSAAAITLATQTVTGAHSDGGFKEVDATNMPGVYRLDLPDAVCATGVPSVVVMLKGAANLAPVLLEIQLTDFDLNTAAVTAAGIADAVLDEATSGHTSAGSFSKAVTDILADTGTDGVKIAAAQTVATVTNLTNLPTIPANWITAAGVATGAIDADAIASNAITSAKIATGAITNAKFASGAIDAAAIATNAIGASELAADAITEIQNGLALEATLTAIKGAGWSTETLAAIHSLANTTFGYSEDIKTKTDNLPATPANEATLTAIKGVGWTNQTLAKIVTDISNISAGSGATPQQIWEYATRVLTAGTNIDLSALATATDLAAVKSVADDILVDTSTTLDGKLNTIDTNVDSILADTGTDGVVLKADAVTEITDDIFAEVVENSLSYKQVIQVMAAVLAGKVTGGATGTITFKDLTDAVNRVVMTVDSSGNRSAVTTNFS